VAAASGRPGVGPVLRRAQPPGMARMTQPVPVTASSPVRVDFHSFELTDSHRPAP